MENGKNFPPDTIPCIEEEKRETGPPPEAPVPVPLTEAQRRFAAQYHALIYGFLLEKKLEIRKDPHCGAFALIRLCSYFAAYLALCACVDFTPRVGLCWTLALVLERALSGLAVASFPMAKNTGLAHTFATAADRTTVRRVLMVLAALLSAALLALGGWALVLAAFLVFARYHVVSDKQFGGITGDLAGWFLQKAELWMLAALCACQWGGLL